MGFEFRTEEQRNPTQQPSIEPTKVEELEKEVALLNEFLELIGRAHIYDMWKHDQATGENTIDVTEWEANQPKVENGN